MAGCNRPQAGSPMASGKLPDKVDFNFHVKPVLADRYFACHGPDDNAREADLTLDLEESAYAALKEMPEAHAIVPGKPGQSMVYLRITSADPALQMPPPSSHLELSAYDIRPLMK